MISQEVQTWEYRVLRVPFEALESALNELGADHWELVTVLANQRAPTGTTTCSCILKRPQRRGGASIPWSA